MNKYLRNINTDEQGLSDVYDVLRAFNVTDPAVAHAVKKLLYDQDIRESIEALGRVPKIQRRESPSLDDFLDLPPNTF